MRHANACAWILSNASFLLTNSFTKSQSHGPNPTARNLKNREAHGQLMSTIVSYTYTVPLA